MRQITKDIQITIDGSLQGFRLTKPDAFSGVEILRLLLRLQEKWGQGSSTDERRMGRWGQGNSAHPVGGPGSPVPAGPPRPLGPPDPTVLDLITSLSGDELRSVMTSCLNHVSVLLPAGPNPVMTGSEWGYPELKHDTVSSMKLVLEEIAWALEGFFGDGGRNAPPADVTTSP